MTLPETPFVDALLAHHASARPDAVAVHFPTHKGGRGKPPAWTARTFGDLDREADAYAHGFTQAGLVAGDRVLLALKPSAEFYPVVFGLMRARLVPVFIDPGMGPKNALRCIEQIAPKGLLAIPAAHAVRTFRPGPFKTVEVAITAGSRWWWGGLTLDQCRKPSAQRFVSPPAAPDDDAVLVFTSGSTGPAKAVSLTHRCMSARVTRIRDLFALDEGTTILETLLVYTILEVSMGLTVVVPPMDLAKPATVDPRDVVATVRAFSPSIGSASPVVWERTVRHCQDHGIRLDEVRMMLTTAAPIPVSLHARLADVFPASTELFTPYGATEAMPIARIGTHEVLADTGEKTARGAGTCVGALDPHIDLRIMRVIDEPVAVWSEALALPHGEIGEIVVAGDGVSRAYRNHDKGNADAKMRDGELTLHRMGDLGYLDAQGRLWFCGRKSHRVDTVDGLLPSVCVQGLFDPHPGVRRTALVGVGPAEAAIPVLAVELEPGVAWTPELEAGLRARAIDTPYEDTIKVFLHHPGFPTDTRHNSKIRNEEVAAWAASRVSSTALTAAPRGK